MIGLAVVAVVLSQQPSCAPAKCLELARAAGASEKPKLLEQACVGGAAEGCVSWVKLLKPRAELSKDELARAREVMARGCLADPVKAGENERARSDVCSFAGMECAAKGNCPAPLAASLEDRCRARDPAVCRGLLKGAKAGEPRQREWAASLCLAGDARDCTAGFASASAKCGEETCDARATSAMKAGDVKASLAFLQKGCDADDAFACGRLATWLYDGKAVPPDVARAISISRKRCTDAETDGCYLLGLASHQGVGVKQDVAEAKRLFKRACDGGDGNGCDNLGVLLSETDPKAGLALLEYGCALGSGHSCANATGALLMAPAPDFARVAFLGRLGCERKDPVACQNAGVGVLKGGDEAEGFRLLHEACALGAEDVCGSLRRNGR